MTDLNKNTNRIPVLPSKTKKTTTLVFAVVLLLYTMSVIQTEAYPHQIITNIPIVVDFFIDDMLPPNPSYFADSFFALLETWNIALLSTTLSALFCLPIAFVAAGNINRNWALYHTTRFSLNVLRTIPDIIWAVLFVAFVGLGALSGVLALFFFSLGIIVKLVSETIEAIDPGPQEAIRAAGGNLLQVIWFGAIPQILPQFASYTLYVLEINVRASIVLGFVGAGGIGQLLERQISVFNYGNISMVILVTFVAVTIIDTVSTSIRKRLV
ncbi:phosphonate ABC transporter, permease protein PhnE [Salsuginibacillus kocurii]|uniref:phosphonate ABC transporter, permease protein PhnE n=1 Tax=Salsuginibacillus kocurii TaxID=427078 RepID=UPI00035E7947|nr:phosphonate ABC transporter, permease protein PhnE [Salsuginibacillus kocurii]